MNNIGGKEEQDTQEKQQTIKDFPAPVPVPVHLPSATGTYPVQVSSPSPPCPLFPYTLPTSVCNRRAPSKSGAFAPPPPPPGPAPSLQHAATNFPHQSAASISLTQRSLQHQPTVWNQESYASLRSRPDAKKERHIVASATFGHPPHTVKHNMRRTKPDKSLTRIDLVDQVYDVITWANSRISNLISFELAGPGPDPGPEAACQLAAGSRTGQQG